MVETHTQDTHKTHTQNNNNSFFKNILARTLLTVDAVHLNKIHHFEFLHCLYLAKNFSIKVSSVVYIKKKNKSQNIYIVNIDVLRNIRINSPASNIMGNTRWGAIPPAEQYSANFPIVIAMPFAPVVVFEFVLF